MPKLRIVRGCSGSGKSTLAKTLPGVLIEADMFHIDQYGHYNWKHENAHKAHQWCQARAKALLDTGHDVVVANTFTTLSELRPYIEWDYDISFYDCTGDYGSIHDVPEATMEKMRARWISKFDVEFDEYVTKWRLK